MNSVTASSTAAAASPASNPPRKRSSSSAKYCIIAHRAPSDAGSATAKITSLTCAVYQFRRNLQHACVVNVYLETERLILREFTADDAALLVDLDSDPDVMHFITGGRSTTREEIEDDFLPGWLDY